MHPHPAVSTPHAAPSRPHREPHRECRRRHAFLFWLSIAVLISGGLEGCSGGLPPAKPLPDLHLPGVVKIAGLDRIVQGHLGSDRERLSNMATYQPAGEPGQARVLLVVGSVMYDFGIDGSSPRQVTLAQGGCLAKPTVSPDGTWMLCQAGHALGVASLTAQPRDHGHLLRGERDGDLPEGNRPYSPTWAPDGRRFAVVSAGATDCSIDLYSSPPPHSAARMLARLTIPQFASSAPDRPPCSISQVEWSRDGTWLALRTLGSPDLGTAWNLSALNLAAILPRLDDGSPTPITVSVTPQMLVALGSVGQDIAWRPTSTTLTAEEEGSEGIAQWDLATRQGVTLLSQRVAWICALSWTPDGAHLVFSLCQPGNEEVGGPPAQLYVFTPSGP